MKDIKIVSELKDETQYHFEYGILLLPEKEPFDFDMAILKIKTQKRRSILSNCLIWIFHLVTKSTAVSQIIPNKSCGKAANLPN